MKNFFVITLIMLSSCLFFSECSKKTNKKQLKIYDILKIDEDSSFVITEKIMYDVPIVNDIIGKDKSRKNRDWFWENLPSPDGENFIKSLFDDIFAGKLEISKYDVFGNYEVFDIIPKEKLNEFLEKSLVFKYEYLDTLSSKKAVIKEENIKLDYKFVRKLRFLERWYIKNGEFNKKVIAIAPFFTVQNPTNKETYDLIKFWIIIK